MTENQIAISSLAMDLKRVALGYHRGSQETAQRFAQEALKRKEEITDAPPYLKKILESLPQILSQKDKEGLAEDTLMYSILFQNYVLNNS
ncbi:MAG: hypothetical protein A2Z11_04650 [Candidatus Woykebacteria bacterium RBG_16_43_9]|uniref:Uncharacterized protein n=1 Tax=Candidatus Woykebacteria bacterium RBG_16_43_9 TaxID=1802596 RepID=A0A1G1WD87_9BACT|nr:MAG: hypothetical protein A2Z11_04650 [Candidatus Woykebacteria bacterium RBG_16_43_9]